MSLELRRLLSADIIQRVQRLLGCQKSEMQFGGHFWKCANIWGAQCCLLCPVERDVRVYIGGNSNHVRDRR